jgi:hypothetical protein
MTVQVGIITWRTSRRIGSSSFPPNVQQIFEKEFYKIWLDCDLKTVSAVFGVKASWNALDYWSGFNDIKKGNKIKSTIFLLLCVFAGLARYDKGSR